MLASQIAITALFALSLDLILGFSGIVSLGHAAYFGVGAYTAGLLSVWGWGEPLTGLLLAGLAAGMFGYLTSFVIARFRHLALIMITLGLGLLLQEAANSASWLTGGFDGLQGIHTWPIFGKIRVRSLWLHRLQLRARRICFSFSWWRGGIIHSPFGLALRGIRENGARMPAIGAPMHSHIRTIYTIAAIIAGIAGAMLTQTTETVSLEALGFQRSADVLVMLILGGTGRLYGGLDRRRRLHGRARPVLRIEPAILVFLDRPPPDRRRDVAAERHPRRAFAAGAARKGQVVSESFVQQAS